jgi:hypothetical protein
MLTAERLREVIRYDPESGLIYPLQQPNRPKRNDLGRSVGRMSVHGYVRHKIEGKDRWVHRLAWLYMTGEWPAAEVDHVNGVRHDNRWGNLRAATKAENAKNNRGKSVNGYLKGTYPHYRKWSAALRVNGKRLLLGYFATEIEAHNAYMEAARKHYGVFATRGKVANQRGIHD